MQLIEKDQTSIKLSDLGDGRILIENNSKLSYLSKTVFDSKNNEIVIEDNVLRYKNEISASKAQKVTGPWNGNTWRISFEEVTSLMAIDHDKIYGYIDLSIGKFTKTDKIIIYYRENLIIDGYKQNGEEILVLN